MADCFAELLAGQMAFGLALRFFFGSLGGALPPPIPGPLLASFGSWALSLLLAALVSISLLSTYLLPETDSAAFALPREAPLEANCCR